MFRKLFLTFCWYLFITSAYQSFGQESAPGIIITCPASHQGDAHSYILHEPSPGTRTSQSSNFIVEYIGFTEEAKIAFRYAIDIWQTKIHSSVPIRVRATWKPLDEGVLGSAGATTIYRNFDGALRWNTWYPVALAEKLARKELNDPLAADIVADFNSEAKWYLKTDGNTPSRETDFVTVALHEIAHGLGFVSSMDVEDGEGSWGTSNFPLTFDIYIENLNRQKLTNTSDFPNPSTALGTQLTSNDIFFRGPVITTRAEERPKLFAPADHDIGSSISHLDERVYPRGNVNSLMTPQIATAEAVHEPGPVLLDMFAEIGWESTYIDVSGNKDIEDPFAPVTLRAKIFTENEILPETLILHYSTNNFASSRQLLMQPTGNPNEYAVQIPAPMAAITISYYIQVTDIYNRNFSSPTNAPSNFHQIRIGPDLIPPSISHEPIEFIFIDKLTVLVSAVITDNVGIKDVTVEYSINNTSQPSFTLAHVGNDVYVGDFIFQPAQLSPGDEINYRIIARDVSRNVNTTYSPSQGFHTIKVRDIFLPRVSYINDFSQQADDFIGSGFSVTTPNGFKDPAIHSDHPYIDGSNYFYQLLAPIIVEPFEAKMRWKEIVLLEPGEPNSEYGESDFYDYAIIEGSNDNGLTWQPLAPGYDSRKHSSWLNHYRSNMDGDNSQALGNPTLYRTDSLNLLDTFSPGDVILIRFRLFADEAAHGWGWSIDDVNIQGEPRKLKEELVVRPNPTEGFFIIEVALPEKTKSVDIMIYNIQGKEVYREINNNPDRRFIKEFDLGGLTPGVYLLRFQSENYNTTKRIILR